MILLRNTNVMKRILPIIIAVIIVFSSCASEKTSPKEALLKICEAEARLPAGTIYSTDNDEGSPEFLRAELLAVAYGIPLDFSGIEKGAIRLSGARHPAEFAIFLCKDEKSVTDVIDFCNQRIRALQKNAVSSAPLCGMSREEYEKYLSGAFVAVSGRYVALIISSDPAVARRAFLRAI